MSSDNPYAPPRQPSSASDVPLPPRWRGIPLLLWVALLAYCAFTAVLLNSVSVDQQAGMMFSVVAVALILSGLWASVRRQGAARVALIGAVGQVIVCGFMLALAIGQWDIVLNLNAGIFLGFVLLAIWYRLRHRIPLPTWGPTRLATSADHTILSAKDAEDS